MNHAYPIHLITVKPDLLYRSELVVRVNEPLGERVGAYLLKILFRTPQICAFGGAWAIHW